MIGALRSAGILAALLLVAGMALTGCREPGPAEEAGREIDEAVEDARDTLDELGADAEDALEEIEDELE